MDLMHANSNREDEKVLLDYDFDLAFGADENDFECTIDYNKHCCEGGDFLYIEGTEYGGIIDSVRVDTDAKEVAYGGRTWHGILQTKILEPDAGADYLVLSGEANAVLKILIARMNLSDLFQASAEDSGVTISNYQMDRYIGGYSGIRKMLKAFGAKLKISFYKGMVILAAVPITDYTQDDKFDSDFMTLTIKRKYRAVNHLICLGKGELSKRKVIHLYADANGNVSHTQSLTGLLEVTEKYDYPSVESEEELEQKGIEKLKSLQNADEVGVDFNGEGECYDIGDIVGAVDRITGLSVSTEITKKIVTIKNGVTNISYKVGE
ncbi:MAG: hypothetical protein IKK59_05515 [Lachnospiraceae bacterium]|nr:hypothetical protein [Lachnospiraceae bacterium]